MNPKGGGRRRILQPRLDVSHYRPVDHTPSRWDVAQGDQGAGIGQGHGHVFGRIDESTRELEGVESRIPAIFQ
jgi:hypothetical protein